MYAMLLCSKFNLYFLSYQHNPLIQPLCLILNKFIPFSRGDNSSDVECISSRRVLFLLSGEGNNAGKLEIARCDAWAFLDCEIFLKTYRKFRFEGLERLLCSLPPANGHFSVFGSAV